MRGSLGVVIVFLIGCVLGYFGLVPESLLSGDTTRYILYLLMFLVGISIGSDTKKMRLIVSSINMKILLVPLGTMAGTLLFSALASLLLTQWGVFDCMAVGSGFAYYSLSSILITQFKEVTDGVEIAAQLGAIALLSNIIRELTALMLVPVLSKKLGPLAAISAAGVNSMDVGLPVITRYCGQEIIPVSIIHGLILDISVPFWVSVFCSI